MKLFNICAKIYSIQHQQPLLFIVLHTVLQKEALENPKLFTRRMVTDHSQRFNRRSVTHNGESGQLIAGYWRWISCAGPCEIVPTGTHFNSVALWISLTMLHFHRSTHNSVYWTMLFFNKKMHSGQRLILSKLICNEIIFKFCNGQQVAQISARCPRWWFKEIIMV